MEMRVIAFSMMAVLAILFVAAYFLAPKEKEKMKLESKYSELLLSLVDKNSTANEEIKSLGLKLGKTSEQIEKDIKVILSSKN